ncbi:CDKL2 protein, partial [Amia calva]|nr:CDKL2 protein [Amia calva]
MSQYGCSINKSILVEPYHNIKCECYCCVTSKHTPHNFPHSVSRANEKMKKHVNVFNKKCQQSLSNHYNANFTGQVSSERSVVHERAIPTERNGNKKKGEFCKTDVHLPELKNHHLPELKGAEGKHSKMLKKEPKKATECRIPSIAAVDMPSSTGALQQISVNSVHEGTEASFPRVDY